MIKGEKCVSKDAERTFKKIQYPSIFLIQRDSPNLLFFSPLFLPSFLLLKFLFYPNLFPLWFETFALYSYYSHN